MKIRLAILAVVLAASLPAQSSITALGWSSTESTAHASRTVEAPGHFYIVEYEYSTKVATMTLVGCDHCNKAHYAAAIDVFEIVSGVRKRIGIKHYGKYTVEGCFEDDPMALVDLALMVDGESANDVNRPDIVAFQEWRRDEVARKAFEAMPLYEVSDGVLSITERGKRDLKAVTVGDLVLWGVVPIKTETLNGDISGTGALTLTVPFTGTLTTLNAGECISWDTGRMEIKSAPCSTVPAEKPKGKEK